MRKMKSIAVYILCKLKLAILISIFLMLVLLSCSKTGNITLDRSYIETFKPWKSFSAEGNITYRIKKNTYGASYNLVYIEKKGVRLDFIESLTGTLLAKSVIKIDSLLLYMPFDKSCFIIPVKEQLIRKISGLPVNEYDIKLLVSGCIIDKNAENITIMKDNISWKINEDVYTMDIRNGFPSLLSKKTKNKLVYLLKFKGVLEKVDFFIPRSFRIEFPAEQIIAEIKIDKLEAKRLDESLLKTKIPGNIKIYR